MSGEIEKLHPRVLARQRADSCEIGCPTGSEMAAELASLRSALASATARAETAEATLRARDEMREEWLVERDAMLDEKLALSARVKELETERDAAVAAEREACARVADDQAAKWAATSNRWQDNDPGVTSYAAGLADENIRLAAAIRSRTTLEVK